MSQMHPDATCLSRSAISIGLLLLSGSAVSDVFVSK